MVDFFMLSSESRSILGGIPALINKTFPIPGRFRGKLPSDVAELSRLLTSSRGDRSLSYLGRPNFLSAYLHYFLPWNLYRLCLLLPALKISLSAGNTITDLGCGPLTFASALWITRPDLRAVPLEFNCIDRVFPVLEAGKNFFSALGESSWKINLIKKDVNIQKFDDRGGQKNASLVCAVNLFNEMHDRISHNNTEALRVMAAKAAHYMHGEAAKDASILTVEPGVPQSGKFISLLRSEFIKLGRRPASPCTHEEDCPLLPRRQGGLTKKERWCHFAFEAADTPKDLQNLSKAAKLPKERLVFSFLLTGTNLTKGKIRVISDAFPLPGNRFGRYGCSGEGLVLLSGEKKPMENPVSLSLVEQGRSSFEITATGEYDAKSGALIYEVK